MVAGQTKRRSLRIVALVAAAGAAVALVRACSATGGTAGAGATTRRAPDTRQRCTPPRPRRTSGPRR